MCDDYSTTLKRVWGFDAFRGTQRDAIRRVVELKEDVLVITATGGGKSLIYAFPPVHLGRVALVISPLISLMQDQVCGLTTRGISACFLGSAQTDASVYGRVLKGEYSLVFLTAERFLSMSESDMMRIDPCLVAVDEAHCVSEWGHDFRVAYKELCRIREKTTAPIVAVTATATEKTVTDIVQTLGLKGPVLRSTCNRTNLRFSVRAKPEGNALRTVSSLVRPFVSTIIYLPTTKEVDDLHTSLNANGIACAKYHSKMSMEERHHAHETFITDNLYVMCATIGYGMGVDKPDVRLVVHWGPCKTLEAYYQQAGRAGRDGEESSCIMFTNNAADWAKMAAIVKSDNEESQAREREGIARMKVYTTTGACRRLHLVQHFGEEVDWTRCEMCDNCTACAESDDTEHIDVTSDAKILLRAAVACKGYYGASTVVDLVLGKVKSGREWLQHEFGEDGTHHTRAWWSVLVQALVKRSLLNEEVRVSPSFVALCKGDETMAFLEDTDVCLELPVSLWATTTVAGSSKKKRRVSSAPVYAGPSSASDVDSGLRDALCRMRRTLADGQPAYLVLNNATIDNIAQAKPRSLQHLRLIHGIGSDKVHKYGDAILKCVQEYVAEASLPSADAVLQSLKRCRTKLAAARKVAPYMLLAEPLLRAMVDARPRTVDDLCRVGMPQHLAYEVGMSILDAIKHARDE